MKGQPNGNKADSHELMKHTSWSAVCSRLSSCSFHELFSATHTSRAMVFLSSLFYRLMKNDKIHDMVPRQRIDTRVIVNSVYPRPSVFRLARIPYSYFFILRLHPTTEKNTLVNRHRRTRTRSGARGSPSIALKVVSCASPSAKRRSLGLKQRCQVVLPRTRVRSILHHDDDGGDLVSADRC